MNPEPRPEPARPREIPTPTPDREIASTPSADPYAGWEDPNKAKKKGLLGSNKFQTILAVVILAAVAAAGALTYLPHQTASQSGSTSASQSPSADQSNPSNSRGSITVSVNGQPYGTFDATQSSIILNHFLHAGDQVTVACVTVPSGAQTVVARVGTDIRVYESRPLHAGEQQTWGVRRLKKGDFPGNTAGSDTVNWFVGQANQGNAVAEYGLANMYVVGVDGLTPDHAKAIALFQQAAAQNYQDAAARITRLQQEDQAGH